MARQLRVEIVGDTRDLDRAFNRAGRSTSNFGSKLGGLAKGGAITAAIGGIALLGKGLFDSVGAAKEAEQAQTRLESALASANVSYAKHGDAIDAAIQKTSKLAALDDEELSDAFARLVRTTGDVTKATEGMALAADIARARNIDLEKATGIVEKAHVGQTRGLKAVGVELEKGATKTEALEAAQKKFGGAAERYGNQATASQEKLGVAFENLQEKVGQKVLPVLAKLSVKLIELIEWSEKNWPKFRQQIQPVIDSFEQLWAVVQTFWKIAQPILEVALPAALKVVAAQVKLVGTAFEVMQAVVTRVVNVVLSAVDKFLGGIQAVADAASHVPGVGDKFRGVADAVGRARERVRDLQASINSLHGKDITINVNTIHHERSIDTAPGGAGGRAAGGPVTAGVAYTVGERGRELFVPSTSGTIIPNHRLAAAGSGGPQTIIVQLGDNTIARLVRNAKGKFEQQNGAGSF